MKTSKLIKLLTDAINAVNEANELVVLGNYVTTENGDIDHVGENSCWTSKHSLQSAPCQVFRELWDELPESLRSEEGEALVSALYPHKYEADNYAAMRSICHQLHSIVFNLWQEMHDAREKFDF